jgi:ribosomal protein L16/L10AE
VLLPADGMTGVKNGAQKLGFSMNELSDYVQLVADNSKDLANLGGSVYKGRQALENMGKAMEPARESMLKMGLMPKDIAEGMAGYLRTQTRLGNAQKMSVDQLAEGARKYLIEQDALTKLTGVQRSEREKAREEAMMEEQHAGVIRELQMQGERGKLEADRVQKISDIANDFSPAIAKMIRSLQSGVITDEGAKLLQSAPNAMRDLALAQKGQISELEAIKRIFGSVGESGDRFRASLAKLSANDDTYVSMGETTKARIAYEKLQTMSLEEIRKEQIAQGATGKKSADAMVDNQAKLIDAQIRATIATENFISKGIEPAQKAMKAIADATTKAAGVLNELTPGGKSMEKKTAENVGTGAGALAGMVAGVKLGAMVGAGFGGVGAIPGSVIGALLGATVGSFGLGYAGKAAGGAIHDATAGGPPGRAAGGPVDAGKLYKVGERGEEYFKPNIAGEIVPHDQISGIAGAANNRIEIVQRAAKEIADDTATLAKLTDVDLKKTQDASRLQDRLRKLKTELAIDEVDLLEEQKTELTKMLDDMEKSMGKGSADAMRKSITMQRAMGGSGMGSGRGLQMPSASGLPSMGGGTGLQIASQDDLKKLGLNIKAGDVQANNAKISPKLIELAKAIQGGVPGFGYFSSFNDKFHNENAPSSMHTQGLAVDFTVAQPPSIQDGKAITCMAQIHGCQCGH